MGTRKRGGISIVVAVTAALALATTVSAPVLAGSKQPTGSVIKVGYVDQNPASLVPQLREGLQAYLDDWNARGGYKNHPLELIYDAPGRDPAATQAAVNKQVVDDGVVALLGMGLCQNTISTLKPLEVPVLPGAISTDCYDPSFMYPAGPQAVLLPAMKFANDEGVKNFGILYPDSPGFSTGILDPLEQYIENNRDQKLTLTAVPIPLGATAADIDLAIVKLKDANVTGVLGLGTESTAELMMNQANINGFGPQDDIKWFWGPNLYLDAAAALPALDGTYVLSQWYPWEDTTNPAVKKMNKVMEGNVDPLDGFAATGYQQGAIFEKVLKKVKGDVTRESVQKAAKAQTSLQMPLAPYKVDMSDFTKNPSGGAVLQFKDGVIVTTGPFVVIPAKEFS